MLNCVDDSEDEYLVEFKNIRCFNVITSILLSIEDLSRLTYVFDD